MERPFQPCPWQADGQIDILEQVELPLRGAEEHRMDIEAWLQSLGLERYVPAFRDNEINWEALPKLTAEDLKDLGVVLGGHRRKLLAAIAALGTEAPAAAGTAASRDAPVPAEDSRPIMSATLHPLPRAPADLASFPASCSVRELCRPLSAYCRTPLPGSLAKCQRTENTIFRPGCL